MAQVRGFAVRGLDSDLYDGCDFSMAPVPIEERIKDLRDVDVRDLAGIDVIVHLAALSNDPVCEIDPALTMAINYEATLRLAKLAKAARVARFVFASSCTNYGLGGEEALTEEAPLQPLTVYGESKVKAERELLELADDRFSPVILRNATAYGIAPRLRLDLVVNDFCASAVVSHAVKMQSDGSAWRPLIHVSDIARACLAAAQSPRDHVHGQVFNIGITSENYRIRDVAAVVAAVIPGCTVSSAEHAPTDRRSYRVDCSKVATRMPQFEPRFTLAQGIAEIVGAFRRDPNLSDEFERDRYRRIARLRAGLESGRLTADLRVTRSSIEMLEK
jgi:nucleoside-diphosphate-sugar epimerase